jgi:hypothetical protein
MSCERLSPHLTVYLHPTGPGTASQDGRDWAGERGRGKGTAGRGGSDEEGGWVDENGWVEGRKGRREGGREGGRKRNRREVLQIGKIGKC